MSNTLDSKDFGLKIYDRFPPKYREDDARQNYALKRYLEALSDGGFAHAIEDINGITTLIDPEKIDAKFLPILFKQYGLEVFNGIPEEYLRYLLPKLGEAWSKKGSLSVVEFIISSLSGIKTSTQVTYDDNGNPLVDVRLEMDYNIGNYVPNVEQFNRLLKNFVPSYSDVNMLFSYLFFEEQVLNAKDNGLIMLIKDIKDELGVLSDDDFTKNFLSFISAENQVLKCGEDLQTIFKLPLAEENLSFKGVDFILNMVRVPLIEELSIVSPRGVPISDSNAILGFAVVGKAILADSSENADVFKDTIIETVLEQGNIQQETTGCDIVITGGERTVIYR